MMNAFLALLFCVAAAWNEEYTVNDIQEMDTLSTFKEWAKAFDRSYESIDVESAKYAVWLNNLETIADSNSMNLTYKLALNQFSDMTGDEFSRYIHADDNMLHQDHFINPNSGIHDSSPSAPAPAPDSVDWTTKGVVTRVKDQGQCGGCWAFATTGALECDYAIKTGTLNSLSAQQLIDCAGPKYGCAIDGCNGCSNEKGMNYTKDFGVCAEDTYRYVDHYGECKEQTCGPKYNRNSGYLKVTANNETSMVNAVAVGCVAIGIEADQTAFQSYSSGVLTGQCGTSVDHAVLIVGYGTTGGQDYWKVKNSWGMSWGMDGYILICRNCDKNGNMGECGILRDGSFPTF